jgi:hypothetical protein
MLSQMDIFINGEGGSTTGAVINQCKFGCWTNDKIFTNVVKKSNPQLFEKST